jgi:hypothetical protein
VLPNATLTNDTGFDIFAGSGVVSGKIAFCFSDEDQFCAAGGEIVFSNPVNNLKFDIGGFDPGLDSVTISAFSGANLLATIMPLVDQTVTQFSTYTGITRLLFIDNASALAGAGYSDFMFDEVAVPVPGTLALVGAALFGGAMLRRRRSRTA